MRDCENCEHYIIRGRCLDGVAVRGCELWDCDKEEKDDSENGRQGEE